MQRDERTSLMATWWIGAVVCALFAVKKRKAVIGVVLKRNCKQKLPYVPAARVQL